MKNTESELALLNEEINTLTQTEEEHRQTIKEQNKQIEQLNVKYETMKSELERENTEISEIKELVDKSNNELVE